jgi:acyl-CoA thioester hydrolase
MGEPFLHSLRPRYSECDMQGIVFNGHYFDYFDCGMIELWRAAFGGYQAMLERGIDMVLAETHLRYRAPARFDEQLTLEVAVTGLGTTSIHTRHAARRGETLLVEGSLRHVIIDGQTLSKTPIPDWVAQALTPWVVELS